MRTISLTISLLIFCFSVRAQMNAIQVSSPTSSIAYGTVSYYDPSKVGQKNTTIVTYADIEGSPYWKDQWNPAFLYLKGGSIIKLKNVKLNLFTSDVQYIDDKGVDWKRYPA